jgi:hypothetical protein
VVVDCISATRGCDVGARVRPRVDDWPVTATTTEMVAVPMTDLVLAQAEATAIHAAGLGEPRV